MSDRDTFGPRLRRERERRGISLETLASVTKVGQDLWEGLERNDFSRWPSGIFARAFVRDYARAIGLDGDELVDEFCRLFPIGDRRTNRVIRAQAELIGHNPVVEDSGGIPPEGDRRAPPRDGKDGLRVRLAPRSVAVAIDIPCTLLLAAVFTYLLKANFWSSVGAFALLYYGVSTITLGMSPGTKLAGALRQRIPTLFVVADRRRAHA